MTHHQHITHLPIIGVTLGDPKGIGPEIVAKALADPALQERCTLRVFGDDGILDAAKQLVEQPLKPPGDWRRATNDFDAGQWSAQWVAAGVKAALAGEVAAIVTAPIHKARWHAAGVRFPGHTEYLAHLCGQTAAGVGALFVSPQWRVALVSGHIALKNVPYLLTRERIMASATLVRDYLRSAFHIPSPHLACLALNPHAGEGSLFGLEEREIIAPALSVLHDRGIHIDGPFPADTFFSAATDDRGPTTAFDAVLAMYHDQGLIPLKTVAFAETVQVTMGLPFIRTSVDHGTADDIAWQGKAGHRNLIRAIEVALELVGQTDE